MEHPHTLECLLETRSRAYLENNGSEGMDLGGGLPSARSPDLTPLDFFLWGQVKNEVYASEVHTEDELRQRIERAFEKIKELAARGSTE